MISHVYYRYCDICGGLHWHNELGGLQIKYKVYSVLKNLLGDLFNELFLGTKTLNFLVKWLLNCTVNFLYLTNLWSKNFFFLSFKIFMEISNSCFTQLWCSRNLNGFYQAPTPLKVVKSLCYHLHFIQTVWFSSMPLH